MSLATYLIVGLAMFMTGYMMGVSDGKVEGRIESFQEKR